MLTFSQRCERVEIREIIVAQGHKNILATNKKTFEITKDLSLTKKGECIVAMAANKSGQELSDAVKKALKCKEAKLIMLFKVNGKEEVIHARGNPNLTFNHPTDLVIRKSKFICNRTLAIAANKTANDFSRHIVKELQDSKPVLIELVVTRNR
jgi:hypothetical protein